MRRHLATVCFLLFLPPTTWAQDEPPIHPDEGLKHLRWEDARRAVGETAFISGKIIDVNSAGRVNFLNFDTKRPADFVAVVFREKLGNFPQPLREMYLGKIVRIRGVVSLYRDKPEMEVSSPDQIEILDELPPTDDPNEVKVTRKPAVEGQLTVATFNSLNLFDEHDDPYHSDEGTPAKPRDQLQHFAQAIAELNADVIALQEVENRFYLERFVNVFLSELGYEHVVLFEGNDTRGIDVALISRVPVGPVRSHRHLKFTDANGEERQFNRDVLAVTIEPEGAKPFEAWVVHLKSNSGGREFAEPVRLAEAKKLRSLLDDQLTADPNARIIVLGDFNDTWDSASTQTIVGEGPLSLWSATTELTGELPDTYNEGEFHSMIDFILCSPAMAKAYVKDSYRVIPGSVQTSGSDHNPVAVSFKVE
jgi:endonuclease/exonuclease/phosphatase family metal-dependent hydrolase